MKSRENEADQKLEEYFEGGYVLVTDDMSNMRKTIRNMLRQLGITNVMESDDGDTALKTIKQHETPPCIFVLLDWNMPRLSGVHTAMELRADPVTKDLPIIMIAADASAANVAHSWELGVSGFIIKPFTAQTLWIKMLSIIKARSMPPEHVILLKQGEELAKAGKFEGAIGKYEEARKIRESARLLTNMAETWQMRGNNEKAHELFTLAIKMNPTYLRAYSHSAALFLKEGRMEEALEMFKKACDISPANSERHVTMGEIYLSQGETEKTEASFAKAIENDRNKIETIAEIYLKAGNAPLAEKFFRKTHAMDPGNLRICNRLGIALRKQGKWKDAVAVYEGALKADRLNEVIYFNLGRAYKEGGDVEQAMSNFEKALRLKPDMPEAKEEIASIKAGNPHHNEGDD